MSYQIASITGDGLTTMVDHDPHGSVMAVWYHDEPVLVIENFGEFAVRYETVTVGDIYTVDDAESAFVDYLNLHGDHEYYA